MGLITDTNQAYYEGTDFGGYRHIPLNDIVNNFMFSYVGEGKIIGKANRRDVVFHTKRAMQEFAYDITKVEKIQEVQIPSTLSIPMPQDYVNYVSICWIDKSGIEHPIPKGRITSSPSEPISQDDQGNYQFDSNGDIITTTSQTTERFNDLNSAELSGGAPSDDYFYNADFPEERLLESGKRYGAEPELANGNGMFVIDEANGKINFSSNLVEALITIKYISDGLGTDDEMRVHKFAEEAIYKHVAHAILSSMANVPEYIVNRFKRERRGAMRQAKLRLYDLKTSEMTNVMRGKSKQIKH
tara:strand:- start:12258 stop:13157 length:900 start_codon:yes stop_codon:yes gene_type:complete